MAKDIFDKTIFDGYRVESLTESAQDIIPKYNFDGSTKTTVFISHKHDDLDEIKGLIGLLERKYNIKAYIDSLDKSMPKKTSGETASKIKQRINRCNKFILLATNGAVESKWCNWELGNLGMAMLKNLIQIILYFFQLSQIRLTITIIKVMNTCGFIHILHITMGVKDIRMGL